MSKLLQYMGLVGRNPTVKKTVVDCCKKWDLSDLVKCDTSNSLNLVFECQIKNRGKGILKLFGNTAELKRETDAMNIFQGNGCVELIHCDSDGGVMLRSFAQGELLSKKFPKNDFQATKIVARVIKQLHTNNSLDKFECSDSFEYLDDFALSVEREGKLPASYIGRALSYYYALTSAQKHYKVLHGDLHHKNIIFSENGIAVAIDPKGVVGDPLYEIAAFLRNPMPELSIVNSPDLIVANRVKIFSQFFGVNRSDILKWSYFGSVLAAEWSISDSQPYEHWVNCADIFYNQINEIELAGHEEYIQE